MTIFATHDLPLSSSFGPLAHSGRSLMIALYISTQMRRFMQTIIPLPSSLRAALVVLHEVGGDEIDPLRIPAAAALRVMLSRGVRLRGALSCPQGHVPKS